MTAIPSAGVAATAPEAAPRRVPAIRSARAGWALLAVGATAALAALVLSQPRSVIDPASLALSPAELIERAREVIATTTGWSATGDMASGFEYSQDYLAYLDLIPELDERRRARRSSPPPILFWYRQSARRLVPEAGHDLLRLGFDSPPVHRPSEIAVRLDAEGRLVELRRWPRASESRQQDDAWEPVFEAAGLELGSFRELYARFVPPVPADARFEWTGESDLFAGEELGVKGATVEGRPTYFRYEGAWGTRVPPPVHDLSTLPRGAVGLLVLFVGGLAWRHRSVGRDDRLANRRLALASGLMALLVLAQSPGRLLRSLDPAYALVLAGLCLTFAAAAWIGAVALGPRLARWPGVMDAWSSFWSGSWRRREVASAVLIGACGGGLLALLAGLAWWLPVWLGRTAVETRPAIGGLAGGWAAFEAILLALGRGLLWTGFVALVLELSRMVLRLRLLAAIATAGVVLVLHLPSSPIGWIVMAAYAALWVALLVRWGLLAALIAAWVDEMFDLALVSDLGHWASQTSWGVLAVTFTLLIAGAWGLARAQPAALAR
ncbi:MAG TPA: hypothetical protein VMT85_14370 [Thermoanaerobaculia bacterium]|nr:hypothetical protein [Thermoanaerobaculia bacterium]